MGFLRSILAVAVVAALLLIAGTTFGACNSAAGNRVGIQIDGAFTAKDSSDNSVSGQKVCADEEITFEVKVKDGTPTLLTGDSLNLTCKWLDGTTELAEQNDTLDPGGTVTFQLKKSDFSPGDHTVKPEITGAPWPNEICELKPNGITFTILSVDLDAMKVSHNSANGELSDTDETNPGAFVPINNDDDDYDANNMADKDQSGSITGESDLLPITLHKVDPAVTGSKYTLDIPSQVKIWQNSDRSGAVSGTTEFDANVDTTLYVEGKTVGSGNIKISWKEGTTTLDDCNEIKVTVYNWTGPLNVPGHAIFQYMANGALGSSKWITPSSGTIKTGTDTSDVTILWDGGPVVGKAIYQVNADYVWDLEVNVVQVRLKSGASNAINYQNDPFQAGADQRKICSWYADMNHNTRAMKAELTVETIEGPTVGGGIRGMKFIEMGFIQNGTLTKRNGVYQFWPKIWKNSLEDGNVHLDYATEPAPGSTSPWYDSEDVTFPPGNDVDGFYSPPDDSSVISDHAMKVGDSPQLKVVPDMELPIGAESDDVDIFNLVFDCSLYFAVRTVDTRNGANSVYTQRASAEWQFDGSGTVDGAGNWSKTGSGNTGNGSFTEVSDGSVVPVTTGTPLNTLNTSSTWSVQ